MKDVLKAIDKAVEDREARNGERYYLGGSVIGSACIRQIWYSFRGAYRVRHGGRLLRLFNRGHLEEFRFVGYLRQAGYEVRDYSQRLVYYGGREGVEYRLLDWEDDIPPSFEDVSASQHHLVIAEEEHGVAAKQYGFRDGHFGGHADGILRGPHLPEGWGLQEFKTHGEKSFLDMQKKGLVSSKLAHWVQMQVYMGYLGLDWGLYLAVNKNTDELYAELVNFKPEIFKQYRQLAFRLIESPTAPQRLSNDPSWFACRFCDYREICHYSQEPQKNCRSCALARPAPDGSWYCNQHHGTLPEAFLPKGCDQWSPIK